MTVSELITKLSRFDPDYRVFLDNHGSDEELNEIEGCYSTILCNQNDNEEETIVALYEA
jgi:hypothetical protein